MESSMFNNILAGYDSASQTCSLDGGWFFDTPVQIYPHISIIMFASDICISLPRISPSEM
jgi:hypothetical protein